MNTEFTVIDFSIDEQTPESEIIDFAAIRYVNGVSA